VGNAGSAIVYGLDADVSVPLGFLIPGGLLEAEINLRESEFDDPITGQTRDITELRNPQIDVNFRQDLTDLRLAWGVSYEAPYDVAFFFPDEIDSGSPEAEWTAFVETTRLFGVKTQLEVRNIGRREFPRERRFFAPDRSGSFVGSEVIDRERGAFIKLTVSNQF